MIVVLKLEELEAKIGLNEANALRLWRVRVLAADTELTITTASTADYN